MNDRSVAEMNELEALLRRTARDIEFPATPSIAAAVVARIREPAPSIIESLSAALAAWWARPVARAAFAALGVIALVIGAALAVPQSRSALAELFGLSNVRIEVGPTLGPPPPVLSPESFARPATLTEAREAVAFPLRLPVRDGLQLQPDAVYLEGEDRNAPVVILVYEAEEFDLYESMLGFFGKGGPPEPFHRIEFDGHEAIWIEQGGHIASFLDDQGRVVVETRRSVERATLLWAVDGTTYRLETSLSQEDAVRVAQSLQ